MKMGKKKGGGGSDLGKLLIKDTKHRRRNHGERSARHTTSLNDGYDWNKINLRSVTEDSHLDDFLATAEMAGTEFTAEKRNVKLITSRSNIGVLSSDERKKVAQVQKDNLKYLRIPRRPKWDRTTTPEELDEMEREAFLDWRRWLASAQEIENLVLTPYEKNLEFWRQLWRVVERSDVVAQIVDARNPLLFYSQDLECYVKEMGSMKKTLLLVNKADFLTNKQRRVWGEYFEKKGIRVVFYSALEESGVTMTESEIDDLETIADEESDNDSSGDDEDLKCTKGNKRVSSVSEEKETDTDEEKSCAETCQGLSEQASSATDENDQKVGHSEGENKFRLLHREELLDLFRTFYDGPTYRDGMTTIGLVGYPNVGKSSTINSLLQCKKVSVSTTPGKTKHFQTILVDPEVCLCDCPGLVMPSFVNTKGDMFIWGILPIDQIRDHVPPVNLVASLIPRHVLEQTYGISLPAPAETEDPNRPPVSEELLNAYGLMRGYMTQRGLPDNPRSSRYILKDFVKGKLLYCHAPPGTSQLEFHSYPPPTSIRAPPPTRFQKRVLKTTTPSAEDIDAEFFNKINIMQVHSKGSSDMMGYARRSKGEGRGTMSSSSSSEQIVGKPWKKHNKRNKKEKLRRVYRHLDE